LVVKNGSISGTQFQSERPAVVLDGNPDSSSLSAVLTRMQRGSSFWPWPALHY